jgi:hypothetical protein
MGFNHQEARILLEAFCRKLKWPVWDLVRKDLSGINPSQLNKLRHFFNNSDINYREIR